MVRTLTKNGLVFSAALFGLVLGAGVSFAGENAELGKAAPDFKLKNYDGKDVSLSDYKDKIVVIEWICPNCPVSKGKSPDMVDLAKKYGEKGVVWLAIDSSSKGHPYFTTDEQKKAYASEKHIPYPILTDADGKVGHMYDAKTTPHMFIIDAKGVLVYTGAIDDDFKKPTTNYVSQALDALLDGSTVPLSESKPYGCNVKYASAG